MATHTPLPTTKIIPLSGDVLTVQLRSDVADPTQVVMRIQRNGVGETQFSLTEFSQILTLLQTQLMQAKAHQLNNPPKT